MAIQQHHGHRRRISFETYEDWVRVAAYYVWENQTVNGVPSTALANWLLGKHQIEEKLRWEDIEVTGHRMVTSDIGPRFNPDNTVTLQRTGEREWKPGEELNYVSSVDGASLGYGEVVDVTATTVSISGVFFNL